MLGRFSGVGREFRTVWEDLNLIAIQIAFGGGPTWLLVSLVLIHSILLMFEPVLIVMLSSTGTVLSVSTYVNMLLFFVSNKSTYIWIVIEVHLKPRNSESIQHLLSKHWLFYASSNGTSRFRHSQTFSAKNLRSIEPSKPALKAPKLHKTRAVVCWATVGDYKKAVSKGGSVSPP